jgi:hypothetical protein
MVSVELFAPVIEAGLKEHVAAAGRPEEQVILTAELKPFSGVTETVDATDAPAETVTADVPEMEKSGPPTAWTVRLAEMLWLTDADVPVIVRLYVLAAVPATVLTVIVLVAGLEPGETEDGLNEQFAPVGRPAQAKVTALLNPFTPAAETV